MAPQKLGVNDGSFKKDSKVVNGHRWYYIDAPAKGPQKGTLFLIHGFPDLSVGWRYQIPMLTEMGMRCIALDCMGYSDTGTSPDLHDFGFKAHADAVAGISEQLGVDRVVIGGHDWGGAVVYRVAQWYPNLITHVFAICTPYFKVSDEYIPTIAIVKGGVPQFGYQLQWGSEDEKVEKVVNNEATIRKFLSGLYGGRPKSGKTFMTPEDGVDLELIEDDEVGLTPLMSEEELDYYVKEYAKNGIHGPLNWYRTRKVNWEDEKSLSAEQRNLTQPVLFIQALKENILTPELSRGMDKSLPNLTRGEVPSGHWAMIQTPDETNAIIKRWFEGVMFGGKSKL